MGFASDSKFAPAPTRARGLARPRFAKLVAALAAGPLRRWRSPQTRRSPWKRPQSQNMPDSSWTPTAIAPWRKRLSAPSNASGKRTRTAPRPGDASRPRCGRCAGRGKRERTRAPAAPEAGRFGRLLSRSLERPQSLAPSARAILRQRGFRRRRLRGGRAPLSSHSGESSAARDCWRLAATINSGRLPKAFPFQAWNATRILQQCLQ